MRQDPIQIPRKLATQLLHLAQTSPDLEICGLIGSKNGLPCSCYPITNCAEHASQQFQLDASQQISAMVSMRNAREDFFAIYHSHPTAPATPSLKDLDQIEYPEALHLIISLNTKGVLEIRGFKLNGKFANEIMLTMSS